MYIRKGGFKMPIPVNLAHNIVQYINSLYLIT